MCKLAQEAELPASIPPGVKKVLVRGNTAYFVDSMDTWFMVTYLLAQPPLARAVPADWAAWLRAHMTQ